LPNIFFHISNTQSRARSCEKESLTASNSVDESKTASSSFDLMSEENPEQRSVFRTSSVRQQHSGHKKTPKKT